MSEPNNVDSTLVAPQINMDNTQQPEENITIIKKTEGNIFITFY